MAVGVERHRKSSKEGLALDVPAVKSSIRLRVVNELAIKIPQVTAGCLRGSNTSRHTKHCFPFISSAMCCSFVPRTLLQRLVEDDSLSDEARQEVQSRIDEITQTLSSLTAGADSKTKYKTRYTEVPGGYKEFRSAIWSMATENVNEFNYETREILGTSYQPLPGIPLRTSQEPPVEDMDVNACMEGLRTTYDFYKKIFNRESVDNNGLQIEASIHYSIRFANAFWDGGAKQMIFGDGDGNTRFGRYAGIFKPGVFVQSLDVIAHELTHAVTRFTAGLVYRGSPVR